MHSYELFEVGPDNKTLHPTKKILKWSSPIHQDTRDVIALIFQEYKFTQYGHCYYIRNVGEDAEIYYSYQLPNGNEYRNTWYLKRIK